MRNEDQLVKTSIQGRAHIMLQSEEDSGACMPALIMSPQLTNKLLKIKTRVKGANVMPSK